MTGRFVIETNWAALEQGSPEEMACFGDLGIRHEDTWLTEGFDHFIGEVRQTHYLSAYHLAEWLAWNWWRLMWEPRADSTDWLMAHQMTAAGGGYVWPNITVFSDGERVALITKPTQFSANEPITYTTNWYSFILANDFKESVDSFMDFVVQRLKDSNLNNTDLVRMWLDVCEERSNKADTQWRKFEAILGYDPDEADPEAIRQLIADSDILGQSAMLEVAGHKQKPQVILTADELRDVAHKGHEIRQSDSILLRDVEKMPQYGQVAAHECGSGIAKLLRDQEGMGPRPISNIKLSEMVGGSTKIIDDQPEDVPLAFELGDESGNTARVVMRRKWEVGRRFDLARLLGDRLINKFDDRLLPATKAYTYRQKLQRSFAAELLCPLEGIREFVGTSGIEKLSDREYLSEIIPDLADHFSVSDWTVETILVNHGWIPREELSWDIESSNLAA